MTINLVIADICFSLSTRFSSILAIFIAGLRADCRQEVVVTTKEC